MSWYRIAALSVASVAAFELWGSTGLAQIRITEYSASPNPEWVEFTNVGTSPIDMTDWSWSDSDQQAMDFVFDSALSGGFGIVAPGESVIFTETSASNFRNLWGLPASVKVVGPNTNSNLGSSGDEINIFDAAGDLVDRLTYTSAFNGVPDSRNILPHNLGANMASLSVLSFVGDSFGSYAATDGRVGNPGTYHLVPEPGSLAPMLVCVIAGGLIRRRSERV